MACPPVASPRVFCRTSSSSRRRAGTRQASTATFICPDETGRSRREPAGRPRCVASFGRSHVDLRRNQWCLFMSLKDAESIQILDENRGESVSDRLRPNHLIDGSGSGRGRGHGFPTPGGVNFPGGGETGRPQCGGSGDDSRPADGLRDTLPGRSPTTRVISLLTGNLEPMML